MKEVFVSSYGAVLTAGDHPEFPISEGAVSLQIKKLYAWTPEDIKELRKFLKKLQKQLEANEV